MRAEGVEPPRAFAQWLLRPSRLPVPPRPSRTVKASFSHSPTSYALPGVPPTTISVVGDSVASNLRLHRPFDRDGAAGGHVDLLAVERRHRGTALDDVQLLLARRAVLVLGDEDVAGVLRHGVDAERGDAEVMAHRLPGRRPVRLHRWDVVDRAAFQPSPCCAMRPPSRDREHAGRDREKGAAWQTRPGQPFPNSSYPTTRRQAQVERDRRPAPARALLRTRLVVPQGAGAPARARRDAGGDPARVRPAGCRHRRRAVRERRPARRARRIVSVPVRRGPRRGGRARRCSSAPTRPTGLTCR